MRPNEEEVVPALSGLLTKRRMRGFQDFIDGARNYLPNELINALEAVNVVPKSFLYVMSKGEHFAEVLDDDVIMRVLDEKYGKPRAPSNGEKKQE